MNTTSILEQTKQNLFDSGSKAITTSKKELPKWLWLVTPLVIFMSPYLTRAVNKKIYKTWLAGESGVIENLTAVFLLIAVVYGVKLLFQHKSKLNKFVTLFIIGITFGSFYFLGEEISWGQHFFGWTAPEFFNTHNDQNETNLHNISPLFDQIPRFILCAIVLIGGIFAPIITSVLDLKINKYWIGLLIPSIACLPSAFFAFFIELPQKLSKSVWGHIPKTFNISTGELKECFLALFLMIYIMAIYTKITQEEET